MSIVKITELQSVNQIQELSDEDLKSVVGGLANVGLFGILTSLLFGFTFNDLFKGGIQDNEPPEAPEPPEPPEPAEI